MWRPQEGPQQALINCPYPLIFFGGSRGGGKTDGGLGRFALRALKYGTAYNAVIFRWEMPQADDLIERAKQIIGEKAKFVGGNKNEFRFENGARIRFRGLNSVDTASKYQGQNLTDVWVEEAGNYPDPRPIDRLWGAIRSSHGIPTSMLLSGNPGGPGQMWLKDRFIDPAPNGMQPIELKLPGGMSLKSIYIPSRVWDNRILMQNDPDYIAKLHLTGSEGLVKAWLHGDFNAVEGAYFDCWDSARHVIRPFKPEPHWLRFRAMDWGSFHPSSIGWYAVVSDPYMTAEGLTLPRGCLVKYREWYTASGPNKGVKLTAEQLAQGILEREKDDPKISYGVLDPGAWAEMGGPSVAERMVRNGVVFRRADNKRVGDKGAAGGWDQMRSRLIGDEDGNPMLVFFNTCTDSIRTIPALQHDEAKPEDVDTDAEDHAGDETRYACMSRPWVKQAPVEKDSSIKFKPMTFNDLINRADKNAQRRRGGL